MVEDNTELPRTNRRSGTRANHIMANYATRRVKLWCRALRRIDLQLRSTVRDDHGSVRYGLENSGRRMELGINRTHYQS